MASSSTTAPPVRPPIVQPGSGNSIIINPCQRLNPILECIRNVSKEFGDIVPDFQLGRTTCALYLSLKYHRLHPEYIHQRIQKLGNAYNLRILLLMCDVSEHQDPIRELTKVCLINNITIMVCWSVDEAGLYLSLYKSFEHSSPDMIKERVDKDYDSILRAALTSVSKVNKVDVEMLRGSFGSFANIAKATPEQLRLLPGLGPTKVRRITEAFEKPFRAGYGTSSTGNTGATRTGSTSTQRPPTTQSTPSSSQLLPPTSSSGSTIRPGFSSSVNHAGTSSLTQDLNDLDDEIDEFPNTPLESTSSTTKPRRTRPTPNWNVEFADLSAPATQDTDDAPSTSASKRKRTSPDVPPPPPRPAPRQYEDEDEGPSRPPQRRERSPSPVWDIELDLN